MIGEQQPHDAHKITASRRHHLARHHKPIVFFFGASLLGFVLVPTGFAGEKSPLIFANPGLASLVAGSPDDRTLALSARVWT
jgi:hypothetical protein